MANRVGTTASATWLCRAAALAYGMWGLIHIGVGSTVIAKASGTDPGAALRFLNDARPETSPSPLAIGVIPLLEQHGWNLIWIGGFVLALASIELWRNRPGGALLAFAITGLADIGYLLAFVAPGFVKISTWIGGPTLWIAGALLSWLAWRAQDAKAAQNLTSHPTNLARFQASETGQSPHDQAV